MAKFNETPEGEAFVASGETRETSREIMQAIAFFARTLAEAEHVWHRGGDNSGNLQAVCTDLDIWEHVTGNGARPASDFDWGTEGNRWADEIEVPDSATARWYLTHTDSNGEPHQLVGAYVADTGAEAIAQMLAESGTDDDGHWQAHRVTHERDVIR